ENLAHELTRSGVRVFFDRWYMTAGAPWVEELETKLRQSNVVVVFVGPAGLGSWPLREQSLALRMQTRRPRFRGVAVLLPGGEPPLGFLSLNTWVDLRNSRETDGLLRIAAAIRGVTSAGGQPSAATRANVCPYRGLLVFREEDGPFFFGRDAFSGRLQ